MVCGMCVCLYVCVVSSVPYVSGINTMAQAGNGESECVLQWKNIAMCAWLCLWSDGVDIEMPLSGIL